MEPEAISPEETGLTAEEFEQYMDELEVQGDLAEEARKEGP